ncbi:MAG: M24 family metallopeptidase, partial [Victivallaceae bacterium]|nr:M24 family metallopeptidase [Victivallaceae bacterium]
RDILADSSISRNGTLKYDGKPLTSERLRFEIDMRLAELGYTGTGTICAGGLQAACPHEQGHGALYAGTPVVIDIFPRSDKTGYFGDMTRTFVKGQAQAIVKKAHRAICEAKRLGISLVRIGAVPSEIHDAANTVLEKAGFTTGNGPNGHHGFFHSLGHGVGLDIHEPPRISPNNSVPLRGGEAVTVEPGLYYPEWGGVRQEDLVLLTKSGRLVTPVTMDDTLEIP